MLKLSGWVRRGVIGRNVMMRGIAVAVAGACGSAALGDAYDAPATYYAGATSNVGATLKTQLRTIVSNMTPVNYGDARFSAPYTDTDPNNSSNILTVYNRISVPSPWDPNSATAYWNREHTWPQSRLGASASNGTANIASDQFEVRPADIHQNSSRGNRSYGGAYGLGAARNIDTNFFYPGDFDAGDVARGAFYMTTRWSTITLVNGAGTPTSNEMGDLATLLTYHYADVPDTFERRRNHAIYGKAGASGPALTNPYAQGNRNPYVDHPEWVWAVFGDSTNDSKLSVGAVGTDGSSSKSIDFGRVIVGSNVGTLSSNVTITKAGTDPTYYGVTPSGLATSSISGTNNAFTYNGGSKSISVGLTADASTVGVKSGQVVVDNLDITTGAGVGMGAQDANDVVSMSLTVLSHSEASFSADANVDSLVVNLGGINVGTSVTSSLSLLNLAGAGGGSLTAGLDLDSIVASGDTGMFGTTLSTFSNLGGGLSSGFDVTFSPTTIGLWTATYVLGVSDENITGATTGAPLTLTVLGYGFAAVPEPEVGVWLAVVGMVGLRRRR